MALILRPNICQSSNCKEIVFTETTGAYADPGNLTGWGLSGGDPNPQTGSATTATLTITTLSGDEYEIDLLTKGFPTIYSSTELVITADMIGGIAGDPIPDGIYTFIYSVFSDQSNETYTQTVVQALTCQVRCCVWSMFKDLDVSCDCSTDAKLKALDAWIMLKGIDYSANCGSVDNLEEDLATLNKICLNSNCNNCR